MPGTGGWPAIAGVRPIETDSCFNKANLKGFAGENRMEARIEPEEEPLIASTGVEHCDLISVPGCRLEERELCACQSAC